MGKMEKDERGTLLHLHFNAECPRCGSNFSACGIVRGRHIAHYADSDDRSTFCPFCGNRTEPITEFQLDDDIEQEPIVQVRAFFLDPVCVHCHDTLTRDGSVWVDTSGGDVCPVASLDPGENRPHQAVRGERFGPYPGPDNNKAN